jgi:hypothetical protein
MFSVTKPTMGVWMEAESTVTTVSQGISRPNGAKTALNFLAGGIPAELSPNKLMGESVGDWFAGTTGNGVGFGKADCDDDDDVVVGCDLDGGG